MIGQISLALLLLNGSSIAGQQPVGPKAEKPIQSKILPGAEVRLAQYYRNNLWDAASALADSILSLTHEAPPWDLRRDYVSLVLVAAGTNGEPQIVRMLVQRTAKVRPFGTWLPGLGGPRAPKFYEVLLAKSGSATFKSTYVFDSMNDGLQDRFAAFVKSSVDIGSLARALPALTERATLDSVRATPAGLWLFPSSVPMVMRSAKIAIHSDVRLPLTWSDFSEKAEELCRKTANRTSAAAISPCAHALVNEFGQAIEACSSCESPDVIVGSIDTALAHASEGCKFTTADWATALSFTDQMEALAKPVAVKGDFAMINHPTPWFGLSVGTAIIATGGRRRAKIDSGKIVRDPTRGPATSAMLDYYPFAANPESDPDGKSMRVRLSGGVYVTPDPGVTLQVGVMPLPVRGATLNYGVGIAWQRTLRDGYRFGSADLAALSDPSSALYVRGTAIQTIGLAFTY